MKYENLRTGLTFSDVREMLKHEADAKYRRGEYMFISRATVLGRWHEIKVGMWKRLKAERV